MVRSDAVTPGAHPSDGPPSAARGLRITVLAGGPGAERAVSLDSGAAIAEALRRLGHEARLCDIQPQDLSALDHPADLIFPALHGAFGEDGRLQAILEQRGLRFVASGSHASNVAIDKVATKRLAADLGLPTPEFEVTQRTRTLLRPPLVVKPVNQGSSVLTTIVHEEQELAPALQQVIAAHGCALAERFVAGRELTIGILGGRALPPIWVRPKRGFYDYQAKYHDDATEYDFDTGQPPDLLDRLASDSCRLFEALGCRHLARVDWIVDSAASPWFLEINTLPGFTRHSLLPMAAARAGMNFDELVQELVRQAWEEP
jgi:D-alanine-D-alanine ligase